MLFESPRETRRITHIMTRSGIKDEAFAPDEVSVMVRWAERDNESPCWMEIGDAMQSQSLVIVTHDDPQDFNADLAAMVMEVGPKGIAGELRTQDLEVVDRPARSAAVVGNTDELTGTIRALHRNLVEGD